MGLLSKIKDYFGYNAPSQNVFTNKVNPALQRQFYNQQQDPRRAFTQQALNVRENIKELPRGIDTAIQAPYINRVQQKIDLQNEGVRTHILKRIRQEPDPLKRQKLSKILTTVQTPNVLQEVNPLAMEEGYANRIGGTFFDVASTVAGLGSPAVALGKGALSKYAAKGALERLASYGLVRGAEGAIYQTGRDIATEGKIDPRKTINAAALGALGNAALSPRLTAGAGEQVFKNLVRSATPDATGVLSRSPGFAKVPGTDPDLPQILRGTTGSTADDIMKTHPNIKLTRDVPATDIYGNKVKIPDGEKLTPYELKGNKVLLQDGQTYIVSRNQFENIRGNSVGGEAKPFAPELKGLEETVRGGKNLEDEIDLLLGDELGQGMTRREAREFIGQNAESTIGTKYDQYQLPGGKDYEEIIIRAPETKSKRPVSANEWADAERAGDVMGDYETYLKDFKKGNALGEGNFRSSHWPDEPNPISHLRLNNRTYNGKKVAFMEELQSDWAGEVRKAPKTKYVAEPATNQPGNQWWVTDTLDESDQGKLFDTKVEAQEWIDQNGATPSHPLLGKWQELSVKRGLQRAVEKDAEYFSWINGEQTSARYNLATHVEKTAWYKEGGLKTVKLEPKDSANRLEFAIDDSGVIKQIEDGTPSDWVGKKLDEVIGKGLADKIMSKETGTLSGEGLKFGGEWAENLYDKQVKNIVEDLTGGKVETIDMKLPVNPRTEPWYTESQYPLKPGKVRVGDVITQNDDVSHILPDEDKWVITQILGNGEVKAVSKDIWEAEGADLQKLLKNYEGDFRQQTFSIFPKLTTQQGIRLTPEIKAKIRGEAPDIQTSGRQFISKLPRSPGFVKIPGSPKGLSKQTVTPSITTKAPSKPQTSLIPPPSPKQTLSISSPAILPETKINVNRLNISNRAKGRIDKAIEEVKPQIEAKIGTRLTNKEAVQLAANSSKTLTSAVGRQQTKEWEAALLKTRQQLAASAKSNTLDKAFIENLQVVKTLATDTARKLQSFSISADPIKATPKQAILEGILKVETDTNKILKAAKGVDFSDANQATDFYRRFVKPNAGEWVDLLRYNSMLSSPLTHIKNIATNTLQVGLVKPVEKTLTGVIDVFSKNRTSFAGEGAAYSMGTARSLGKAVSKFADVMSGKAGFTNLDLKYIPTSTGKVTKFLSFQTKLLEGMDQFFTELATGGEKAALSLKKSKGVKVGNLDITAADSASQTIFRGELGNSQQGHLLDGLDRLTGLVETARNSSNPLIKTIAKFSLPFVRTPTNIFKQGIEYSPAGLLTTIGAKNVNEQISKAIIGSTVFGGAATLLGSGRLTWAEPINEKQKHEFRAAGMQPYAVKFGDKWVSFKYLGPLSFPLAMVAAIDYELKQGRLDDTTSERILGGVARYGEFLTDQSYAKGIGDLLKAAGGDESGIARVVGNYPQQLVPLRALGGWMARLTDPTQRKISKDVGFIDKQVQLLMQNIPGLSQKLEPRLDSQGNPIPNQNRVFNAFSPLTVTTENQVGKEIYQSSEDKRAENRQIADLKKSEGGTTSTGKTVKKIGDEWRTFDTKEEADLEVAKDKFKQSNEKSQLIGETLYYRDSDGEVKYTKFGPIEYPKLTSDAALNKKLMSSYHSTITSRQTKVAELYREGVMTEAEASQALKDLEALRKKTSKGGGGSGKGGKAKKAKVIKFPKPSAPKSISSPKLSVRIARYSAPKRSMSASKIKLSALKAPSLKARAPKSSGLRAASTRKIKILK